MSVDRVSQGTRTTTDCQTSVLHAQLEARRSGLGTAPLTVNRLWHFHVSMFGDGRAVSIGLDSLESAAGDPKPAG